MNRKGKASKQQVDELKGKIKKLLIDGIYDDNIISQLKIGRATFFRHKKKVIKEIIKQHKPQPNEVDYQHSMLRISLEDCYRVNKEISQDPNINAQARTAASEMAALARVQMCKLAEEGYIKPQLLPVVQAVHIEAKEITT